MTTFAAIFGTLPIALGLGAGATSRQGLGIAVVGGLIFSQMMTLYVTPAFYVAMAKLSDRVRRRVGETDVRLSAQQLDTVPRRHIYADHGFGG